MFDEAVAAGLHDLTVFRVPAGWQAASRWRGSNSWRVHENGDIQEAIALALEIKIKVDDGSDLV